MVMEQAERGIHEELPKLPTCLFLGQVMHTLTMRETLDRISDRIAKRKFTQHVVVNVAKLIHIRKDRELRDSVNGCDIINIDGVGVAWGARLCGIPVPERVSGIDVFFNLLEMSAQEGYSVFFLGARQEVLGKAVERIQAKFPRLRIAGWHHGYFWEDEMAVVRKIRQSGALLLFVAITSPRKEKFIGKWKERLGVCFVMGVGGALDVVAGKTRRAPKWIQRVGLEWFYRMCQEPRRLWRRYLVTNTLFIGLLIQECIRAWWRR